MHQNLRLFSLFGVLSLALVGLTGCGEKRIHVATMFGAPGDEMTLEPITDNSDVHTTAGLGNASIDESALSSQIPDDEDGAVEPAAPDIANESINTAHDSAPLSAESGSSVSSSPTETPLDPSLTQTLTSAEQSSPTLPDSSMSPDSDSGFARNDNSFDSLNEGQSFSAQSSSSPENNAPNSPVNFKEFSTPPPTQNSDPTGSLVSQDSSSRMQDPASIEDIKPSGDDLETVPEALQIAKAEPSDGLQERMNRIKRKELATAKAGLEDVFFQFDSWTLTQEGKQALQRALGWFEQEPSSNLIIEGHADQRGTQAYNMVLAKKRAVAVHDYLTQLGIAPSRLTIISYGKDKPFCQDSTEVCHQLNRRGHLLVQNP